MSRRVLAGLVGRSEEWLRQVELGHRRLDSIEVLTRLAEILQFENLEKLIGWPATTPRPAAHAPDLPLGPLRQAVMEHPAVPWPAAPPAPGAQASHRVRTELDSLWQVWSGSPERYTVTARRLPALLRDARSAVVRPGDDDAAAHLVGAYHLARHLFTGVDDTQLAWLVADRATTIAVQSHDPLLVAACAWHAGRALLSLGHFPECRDHCVATARHLAAPTPAAPAALTLWGALNLLAAEAAAAAHDLPGCDALTAAAAEAAAALGTDRQYGHVWFGPAALATAAIHTATRLGRLDEAARLARTTELPDTHTAHRRVHHYLTAAYALARRGDDGDAMFALLQAEKACPEDIRYDGVAHRTLQQLIRRGNRLIRTDLDRLAALAGLG